MKRVLIGYNIGTDVQLDIIQKKIRSFEQKNTQTNSFVLRETMFRLFVYLLENASGNIVTNEQILYNVWDLHGLKSSNQRLWQVMQGLQYRLVVLGVPHDLIMRIETVEMKGYSIMQNMVVPLYTYIDKNSSQQNPGHKADKLIADVHEVKTYN